MNPVKGIDDRRNDYDDTQQFVSEQKQIARMADEKSPREFLIAVRDKVAQK